MRVFLILVSLYGWEGGQLENKYIVIPFSGLVYLTFAKVLRFDSSTATCLTSPSSLLCPTRNPGVSATFLTNPAGIAAPNANRNPYLRCSWVRIALAFATADTVLGKRNPTVVYGEFSDLSSLSSFPPVFYLLTVTIRSHVNVYNYALLHNLQINIETVICRTPCTTAFKRHTEKQPVILDILKWPNCIFIEDTMQLSIKDSHHSIIIAPSFSVGIF